MEQIAKTIKYGAFLALVTYFSAMTKADLWYFLLFAGFVLLINIPALVIALTQPDGETIRYERTFCITNVLLLTIGGMILSYQKGFDMFWPSLGYSFLLVLVVVAIGQFIRITEGFFKDILKAEMIALVLGTVVAAVSIAVSILYTRNEYLNLAAIGLLATAALLAALTVRLRYSIPTALCSVTWGFVLLLNGI